MNLNLFIRSLALAGLMLNSAGFVAVLIWMVIQ